MRSLSRLARCPILPAALLALFPPGVSAQRPLVGPVRVCAGGDVTLSTNTDTSWVHEASRKRGYKVAALPDPFLLLAPLRPFMGASDIALVNVEGAIGSGSFPRKCSPGSGNCFQFRSAPSAASALRTLSPRAVVGNVANNHSRDAGKAGFAKTRILLSQAGVFVTGADTLATLVPVPSGDTVAFLGFHTASDVPDARDLALVSRSVARASRRFSAVVVMVHIGAEGIGAQRTRNRTEMFLGSSRGNPVAFAHAAVDAGASLVVGSGPHVLRAAEIYGQGLIFYSLGNLVTYGPFRNKPPMDRSAVVCVSLSAWGPGGLSVIPFRQRSAGLVSPDTSSRAIVLIDSLSALDFPRTGIRLDGLGSLDPDALPRGLGPAGPPLHSPSRR